MSKTFGEPGCEAACPHNLKFRLTLKALRLCGQAISPFSHTYSTRLLRRRAQKGFLHSACPPIGGIIQIKMCQLPDISAFLAWGRQHLLFRNETVTFLG